MRISTTALAFGAVVLGAFVAFGVRSASAQGATYKVVAFTGQPAPGGGTFQYFQAPSIGADGTIGFVEYSGGEGYFYNIYSGVPGVLRRVISSGDSVPGEPNATFVDFGPISVAKDGGIGFNAGVNLEGYQRGIWSESSDDSATGGPTGFRLVTVGGVAFRSGTVFAKGVIEPDSDPETTSSELGAVLKESAGALRDVLRERTRIEGHLLQRIYAEMETQSNTGTSLDVNEAGTLAMKAAVAPGPSPTPFPDEAILAGEPSSPKIVALAGEPAPGLPGSWYGGFSPKPSIASNGLLAFSAYLNAEGGFNGHAIFSGNPGALSPIVAEQSTVPTTTNVKFGELSDTVVNSTGDVIFRARIYYPNESSRTGIWIKRLSGPPVLIAISGMTLPTPSGPQEVTDVDFAGPGTFNDLHQFVFLASFNHDEQGIYVADTRPGVPEIVVRTPRKPRDFVTTDKSVEVSGFATDASGIEKVEYTVAREASSKKKGKKSANKRKNRKMIVSRVKRARGDDKWSFDVPLSMGLNLISIVATDKFGNESEPYKIRMLRYDPNKD